MKKQLFALLLALMPSVASAAGAASVPHTMQPDLRDQASLQRGMQVYVNYCMGCHSLEYQRFSRAADDLNMPQDLTEQNLIFSPDLAFNDQMHSAMQADDGEAWFGAPPPDLTLTARLRGTDWIYSYLLGFYRDSGQPTGVNNTVFDLVAMPNVLEPLQGVQVLACEQGAPACNELQIARSGSMEAAEFADVVYDLTNFLAYVGEPSKLKAQALAPKVLLFIFIFGVIVYLLKREYWRDIH